MNVQKFRISNRGRLSGLLYISDNNPGKIASLLPIASSGAWPAQIDFEVKELIHQQFAAGTSPETIAIQLLERAGLDCGEIVVTPM